MHFIRNNNYLLLIAVLCILFTVIGINKTENEIDYEKVTVAEGDTLWGYAVQYGKHVPTEKWIQEAISLNDLSSTTIRIGEELRIPGGKDVNRNEMTRQIAGDGQ